MADIVRVLSDTVANQIAAGEVILRPASVIKELVENAVDAGSDRVKVIVKDAGRTLIQIVDNGCGMSGNDARLSFERHATSKIRATEDLFAIRTMGFRGEALASIASIAQVELKTRRKEDDMGTLIKIAGSEIEMQEPVGCNPGTSLSVKNLFFNVPARRRFLKSNSTELKHIITEFQRIGLAHPDVGLSLIHNESEIYKLQTESRKERITHLMGNHFNHSLVPLDTPTTIVNISGFIGKPEKARKTYGEQFFFVNNRYMRHPYFHKAVLTAYDALLPPDTFPAYFIFLDIDPAHVDINIHPTKTEIKFDDERSIFQIVLASVKEGLGKFNITPSLDFNQEGAIDIPIFRNSNEIEAPGIRINPDFNPFDNESPDFKQSGDYRKTAIDQNWESLYDGIRNPEQEEQIQQGQQQQINEPERGRPVQIRNKYLVTAIKSGLLLIHQARALERIRYEELLQSDHRPESAGQKKLFPVQFDLNPADLAVLQEIRSELTQLGFEIEEFGGQTVILHAIPGILVDQDAKSLIENILNHYKDETLDLETDLRERMIRSIANASSRITGKVLGQEEMQNLIDRLFACESPEKTPGGKKVLTILQSDEIEKRFF